MAAAMMPGGKLACTTIASTRLPSSGPLPSTGPLVALPSHYTTGTLVAVPTRTYIRKVPLEAGLGSHSHQAGGFSYHDPAFGAGFREHEPGKDALDQHFLDVPPDVTPPLEALLNRTKWLEAEDKRKHVWERFYKENRPEPVDPRANYEPATVCRLPPEEYYGFTWLLAGCP
mmetsp:Transcript_34607/g.99700  ORF Transcript_34607/g.99700 Transcript_34607/m.99700 type:complete len:172 (+) Transcript_34607:78-593(+)